MNRKLLIAWGAISIAAVVFGFIWRHYDRESLTAAELYLFGWISSLLALGYYCTPSNSVFGKISFGFVGVMVAGIVMKVLHLTAANEVIVAGLLGIAATYGVMWHKNKG